MRIERIGDFKISKEPTGYRTDILASSGAVPRSTAHPSPTSSGKVRYIFVTI